MDDTVPTRQVFGALCLVVLAWLLLEPAGCAPYIGTTARSFLLTIKGSPDPNLRYLAYSKLASPQCYDSSAEKSEAVQVLVERLGGSQEPTASRAAICRTLAMLGDPAAREAILKAVGDPEGLVRVQACRALGKVGKPEDATILARIMTVDTLEDCRIAAIAGLGELRSKDPRILQMLVAGMEHDDPAIRMESLKSLRKITGIDRGVDVAAWRDTVLPKADDKVTR
jgi:HEAT repeat protein